MTQTELPQTESPHQRLDRIFKLQQEAFKQDPAPSAEVRIQRMNRIPAMLGKHREAVLAALAEDFGGHSRELGDLIEILGMFDRAEFNAKHIRKWMKPESKGVNPVTQGKSKAYIKYQPKGVVGNMVSWNFPFDIGLGPTMDALCAGNRVIIKPSDLSPACGKLLQTMVAETFDESEVAVVNGDIELAKYFPTLPWNHLVYTGSGAVGREIMKAASVNLVPVTLELGGKCPVVVAADMANDPLTIATIAGIKAIKRGQMCVSADYCLVLEAQAGAFTQSMVDYMQQHFAQDNGAAHACGIISERHMARLNHLVSDAEASGAQVTRIGNVVQAGQRNMPFYVVFNPSDDCAVMREEIFGPILVVKTYKTVNDAIAYINQGDRPLGLYVFSKDRTIIDAITKNTHSGGVSVNAVAMHAGLPSMGFGGVGASGMGRHHGFEGFREFSNPRGYYERQPGNLLSWVTPPYSDNTRFLIDKVAYAPVGQKLKFALPKLVKNLFASKL